MGNKAEIGWRRSTAEGEKVEVFARLSGGEWLFFQRSRRYENWQRVAEPPLEDWLELLDAVRRRVVRRLYQPADEKRLVARIRERFPEWRETERQEQGL
ncbi:MAG: hypothetical protein N3J91_05725 [Verrucomicrobiae bacterium]|nr:hypothetical protein [Verrucomicrobiae bacterium]